MSCIRTNSDTAIIGLGNPGSEYEWTRHNVGFMVVDEICDVLSTEFEAGKGEYLIATAHSHGILVLLVKPLTYMNNSGLAVAAVVERYNLRLTDVLVVCDDFNLPLGKIRLRPRGSDGGHNGLYSIIYQLQSQEFPRLRCGIGPTGPTSGEFDATSFVLSVFDRDERHALGKMIEAARDAAVCFSTEGIKAAMDQWNAVGSASQNEGTLLAGQVSKLESKQ